MLKSQLIIPTTRNLILLITIGLYFINLTHGQFSNQSIDSEFAIESSENEESKAPWHQESISLGEKKTVTSELSDLEDEDEHKEIATIESKDVAEDPASVDIEPKIVSEDSEIIGVEFAGNTSDTMGLRMSGQYVNYGE